MSRSVSGRAPGAGLRAAVAGVLGILSALVVACGGDDAAADSAAPVDTAVPEAPAGPVATGASFAVGALVMAPGEAREIAVRIVPPGRHRVRFALLGDSLDASLDRTEVDTDDDGSAVVGITAPTNATSTEFRVRASVGGDVAAELAVAVTSSATGTLTVSPAYTGARTVMFWVASAHPATACAELTGMPPADGDIVDEAAFGYDPVLSVPAGRALAVSLRGEEKIAGCLEVPPLAAHEIAAVSVPLSDVPLRLAGTKLRLTLDLAALTPSWRVLLAPAAAAVSSAFVGAADDDVDALLDSMLEVARARAPDADFATARSSGGWDGALHGYVALRGGARLLRDALDRWLLDGAAELESSGALVGTVTPVAGVDGKADFVAESFGERAPSAAGWPESALVSWQAEPGDRLLLGLRIPWTPADLLVALGAEAALVAHPAAASVAQALDEVVDCAALGADLQVRALGSMGSCDASCTADVCVLALDALWTRAAADAEPITASVELSATAAAAVDARARPIGCEGTWTGQILVGDETATGSGALRGAEASQTAPTPAD